MKATIPKAVGRAGIITANLCDPLSELLSRVLNTDKTSPNAVGFYYETMIHDTLKCYTSLFNVYDNDAVPWMRMGMTLDRLASSPWITELHFYPLKLHSKHKLDDKFRLICTEALSANASNILEKNVVFTHMLLQTLKLKMPYDIQPITGYDIVNNILCKTQDVPCVALPTRIMHTAIVHDVICVYLNNPITDSERKHIINETQREFVEFASVFIDLYTVHEEFRTAITNIRTASISHLLDAEVELISNIVTGIRNGCINNSTLNADIQRMTRERSALGRDSGLPLSTDTPSTAEITNHDVTCSFTKLPSALSTDGLRGLGTYIQTLIHNFDDPEPLIVNIGGMISAYNAAIAGTHIPPLNTPKLSGSTTISRASVVTLPGNAPQSDIQHQGIVIPMYNADLKILHDHELRDILLYVDSLRDSSGETDTRFVNLQNDIIHELGLRNRRKPTKLPHII